VALADPRLAVGFLGTLRMQDGIFIDDLDDREGAARWIEEWLPSRSRSIPRDELVALRESLRTVLTAVVEGTPPPRSVIRSINSVAARAPVTLAAQVTPDGVIQVHTTSRARAGDALLAELARSGLALLAAPERDRLALCRAPGCVLFFLKHHPRQQWCSPGCGNRARVARHYVRHARH
jgi:predicted RNA-binding Zn ribbon-like protein